MDIRSRHSIQLEGKKVTVIGAARSGKAAAQLLTELGAKVFLSDSSQTYETDEELSKLANLGVEIELGDHSKRSYEADLMVISPGVPQDAEIISVAVEKTIPVIGEVELASWFTQLPIIAVTGSNGKTTTSTILANMVKQGNYTPFLAGNIGVPFSKTVYELFGDEPENGIHILEISSFQMEHILHFKPKMAVLLNLTTDHIDRYSSIDSYAAAKMNLVKNMTEQDFVIYNLDDPGLLKYLHTEAIRVPFSIQKNANTVFSVNETKITDEFEKILVYLKDIALPGQHNLSNLLAAATASEILDIPYSGINRVMKTFCGVPHRLEHIRTLKGVDYYNDSKATNIHSVNVAIDSFSRPIILIMGGRDKGADFQDLLPKASSKVKQILVLGEAADRIQQTLSRDIPCSQVSTIDSAVFQAQKMAEPGDVVLLSPGCASFDMFKNFEERGDQFRTAVFNLRGMP